MAKSKPLGQLGQDLRGALELGIETTTHTMVNELKKRGPYYSGDFEAAWVVEPGQKRIASTRQEKPIPSTKGKKTRQVTPVSVPLPALEKGYTVGNEMEYADIAMDLKPNEFGQFRHEYGDQEVGKDWFERYMLGGDLSKDIENSVTEGFRIAGFK